MENQVTFHPSLRHQQLLEDVAQEVARWQERIPALRAWNFYVEAAAPEETPCGISIEYVQYPREATIKIEERMRVQTKQERYNELSWLVVHELVHLLLADLLEPVYGILAGNQAAQIMVQTREEALVWTLTDAILQGR